MKEYFLSMAGMRMVLRTPEAINISKGLRPFLCEPQSALDCCIEVQQSSVLPPMSKNGVWYGLEYYDSNETMRCVFHYITREAAPFAVTQQFANGNIIITVRPEYQSYFSGSSGIFNRIGTESMLLQHNGLLLHASLIQYAGKAIVFSGPSGVGKSTQAEIWKQCFQADIINGDRAILRKMDQGWIAAGSPYAGSSGIYRNISAPLAAIVVLKQAKENRLQKLTAMEAFRYIYPELSNHNWEKEFTGKVTDLALELLTTIPTYLLECLPEEGAAFLLKKGLDL